MNLVFNFLFYFFPFSGLSPNTFDIDSSHTAIEVTLNVSILNIDRIDTVLYILVTNVY